MPRPLQPSCLLQRCLEILRERRLDVELRAGERMAKAKPVCMQELPLELEVTPHAVLGISGDGQVDRGEVHADLVRAARFQANVEERVLAHELDRPRSA